MCLVSVRAARRKMLVLIKVEPAEAEGWRSEDRGLFGCSARARRRSQPLCSAINTEDCEGHRAQMSLFAVTLRAAYFGNGLCYFSHQQQGVCFIGRR